MIDKNIQISADFFRPQLQEWHPRRELDKFKQSV